MTFVIVFLNHRLHGFSQMSMYIIQNKDLDFFIKFIWSTVYIIRRYENKIKNKTDFKAGSEFESIVK